MIMKLIVLRVTWISLMVRHRWDGCINMYVISSIVCRKYNKVKDLEIILCLNNEIYIFAGKQK